MMEILCILEFLRTFTKKYISKICCLLECCNIGTMKHLENTFVGSTFASNLILHIKALQQQQHNVICSLQLPLGHVSYTYTSGFLPSSPELLTISTPEYSSKELPRMAELCSASQHSCCSSSTPCKYRCSGR